MTGTATLICPKCRGAMRTYERNGVLIDQCEECRGIFLDRGELEQLLDAEAGHPRGDQHGERRHDDEHHGHDEDDERGRKRRTSPGSLIADLLGGGE
jgi:Zn-finger nucleic acid-binding protein